MSRFDPRLKVASPPRAAASPDTGILFASFDRLKRHFRETPTVRLKWGSPAGPVEIVKLAGRGGSSVKLGTVVVHPVLAAQGVPEDVRDAGVFLGILILTAARAQKKLAKHVFDHPELAAWVESQMTKHPASEILARFFAKFEVWAAASCDFKTGSEMS